MMYFLEYVVQVNKTFILTKIFFETIYYFMHRSY